MAYTPYHYTEPEIVSRFADESIPGAWSVSDGHSVSINSLQPSRVNSGSSSSGSTEQNRIDDYCQYLGMFGELDDIAAGRRYSHMQYLQGHVDRLCESPPPQLDDHVLQGQRQHAVPLTSNLYHISSSYR